MTPIYVYFAHVEALGLTKVGVAANTSRRRAIMEIDLLFPVTLLDTIECANWNKARSCQHRAMRLLKEYRTKGEWFKVDPSLIPETIATARLDTKTVQANRTEKQLAQEAEWNEAGFMAGLDGARFNDFPRDQKPYSVAWYRCKNSWQAGWEEAKHGNTPCRLISPIAK